MDTGGVDWKGVLAEVRRHLPPPASGRQQRGSLRWLEAEMRARGANPAALRNIVYRDVGTAADKAALHGILADLARETGHDLPQRPAPAPAAIPDELDLLGRSKKRAYRQFLAGMRAGRAPRLIVTGRAGAGKTVLLDRLDAALREAGVPVTRVALTGDAAAVLPMPPPAGSSYAALAQAQADAARRALPASGALLLRVTDDLHFAGDPPRGPDGAPLSPGAWAATRLLAAAPPGVAVLLATESRRGLEDSPAEVIDLRPPTTAEARTYVMTRLGVPQAEAHALVRETGRHLDRLTLLVSLRSGDADAGNLRSDPDTRRLVEAAAALVRVTAHDPHAAWPQALLRSALGTDPAQLPPHARALLRFTEDGAAAPTPVLRAAWTAPESAAVHAALRRIAAEEDDALMPFRLAALAHLAEWSALTAVLAQRPDDARHLPPLWPLVRSAASGPEREVLARAVVAHHAGRGEYGEPRLRDALFTLLESPHDPVRAWARVKLAESSLEAGQMDSARRQLEHPDVSGMDVADPWSVAAHADVLLVCAALARWEGDLDAATRYAADPRTAVGGPRAELWRGVIAKDAGRWDEALRRLQAVPRRSPLLSARARYQEGDLRLRLGQPHAALEALLDAAARLDAAGGAADERARVLARGATALRRLGRPDEALGTLALALALVPDDDRRRPDGVPRARLLSEGVPILLALNRPDDALAQGQRALELLRGTAARPAETRYRDRRTRYRLALAYVTRGLGVPYLQPLGGPTTDHPDLRQARALLDDVIAHAAGGSDRDVILTFDMHLSRALADPDAHAALEACTRALALAAHPYEEAQARAQRAEALLRAGDTAAALADVNRAHALLRRVQPASTEPPDPGLHAQLLALEARATIHEGAATVTWVAEALTPASLQPFRDGVWREVGRALEAARPDAADVVRSLLPGAMDGGLRPSDALRVGMLAALPSRRP
ncbi:tetratricopeptide (TPR) repeat protein [Deinococcus metalli]|uniref:Tetratricopeptide (TPR) repeat protein n=1 Tax=Deinococcus metalli TaxID=1141878 RepID=A0A7W8KDW8_9DEIO|nr:AAA family ATPase [Deinococcus metalli]MBB5375256.1 tetratricopeptide (TPR) repeat protein [Deinococcus metalli]GHF30605.1 hypothetical protein GCM10017781_03410 [Deinococcus metalli]